MGVRRRELLLFEAGSLSVDWYLERKTGTGKGNSQKLASSEGSNSGHGWNAEQETGMQTGPQERDVVKTVAVPA